MKPDLYIKKVSPKGRVTYQPLTMEILDGQEERHLSDAEAISAALTLATIATTNALKLLPPKKAVVTRIDRTLTSCLKAFQEYNVRIDEELMHHLTWCWNMTMILASMVEVEE